MEKVYKVYYRRDLNLREDKELSIMCLASKGYNYTDIGYIAMSSGAYNSNGERIYEMDIIEIRVEELKSIREFWKSNIGEVAIFLDVDTILVLFNVWSGTVAYTAVYQKDGKYLTENEVTGEGSVEDVYEDNRRIEDLKYIKYLSNKVNLKYLGNRVRGDAASIMKSYLEEHKDN